MADHSHHNSDRELAEAIRANTDANRSLLAWLQQQASGDFTEKQQKKLAELRASIESAISRTESKIMATQAELAADLKLVVDKQKKTLEEIKSLQAASDVLQQKVIDLENAIANGEVGQEITDAVAAVKAQAQIVDDQIPDITPPTAR